MANYIDLPGPEKAAIQQLAEEFILLTGWAEGLDIGDLNNFITANGLVNQSDAAFEAMFRYKLTDAQRAASPWAEFAMTESDYHTKLSTLKSSYYDLTGTDIPPELAAQAFREKWSGEELKRHVTGSADYAANNPWAAEGDTYTRAKETYITQYGQPPANLDTLKSWWNFQRSAKQVKGGGEAVVVPAGGRAGGGQQSGGDTEIR